MFSAWRLAGARASALKRARWRPLLLAGGLAGPLLLVGALAWHVLLDRRGLPDLARFERFELPVTGQIQDLRGVPLAELAREHRRVLAYADIPPVVLAAIVAAEDNRFLSHSGVAATIWLARRIGMGRVLKTARDLGIETALARYPSTALGASEVTLLELANAYRAMASGLRARPHFLLEVTGPPGEPLPAANAPASPLGIGKSPLALIQEGLRGVVRLPGGTAHALDTPAFPVAVMGKTGTTSDFRDALFVGSTFGPSGITVAVWLGFDDATPLGERESGARAALPVFRDLVRLVYEQGLVGLAPQFPPALERGIDAFLTHPPLEPPRPLSARVLAALRTSR